MTRNIEGEGTPRGAGNSSSSEPLLFTPFRVRDVTARNHIVVAPMCQYRSVDGAPTDWHRAMRNWEPLRESDAAAGRAPWTTIGPTACPASKHHPAPVAMEAGDICDVLDSWEEAAKRSVDAGFEICEIHGAHGYLIHQFLSPVSNTRPDAYGGDFAGRIRFALEVTDRVRRALPSGFPLFFRISSIDGEGGHWDLEDSVELARALKDHGVDLVDCSSGGISGNTGLTQLPRVPGYHIGYSSRIRSQVDVHTIGVGMITDPHHAEALLRDGHCDLVAIGRELMLDPNWPVRAAQALGCAAAFDLLPESDAFRLKGRALHAANYLHGSIVEIPTGVEGRLGYSWAKLRPLLPWHDE